MKSEPIRMCAMCREHKPKGELIKVVRTKDGFIGLDPTGRLNGRSVYVCKSEDCLKKAEKSNLIKRTLGACDAEIYKEMADAAKPKQD